MFAAWHPMRRRGFRPSGVVLSEEHSSWKLKCTENSGFRSPDPDQSLLAAGEQKGRQVCHEHNCVAAATAVGAHRYEVCRRGRRQEDFSWLNARKPPASFVGEGRLGQNRDASQGVTPVPFSFSRSVSPNLSIYRACQPGRRLPSWRTSALARSRSPASSWLKQPI